MLRQVSLQNPFKALAFGLCLLAAACGGGGGGGGGKGAWKTERPITVGPLIVTSSAFVNDGALPADSGFSSGNQSPPLTWNGDTTGVQSWAIIMDDADAGNFLHWCYYNIPVATTALAKNGMAVGAAHLDSDFMPPGAGANGYDGPDPPEGMHHYSFRIYGLSDASIAPVRLDGVMDHTVFERQFAGKIKCKGSISGTFTAAGSGG
jgi:Raf kinase inhibitor-like YbhB/YbcL family protein